MFLISVIVPFYNTGQYLSRCLESIIAQTYTNLEIILINDGSTDNSTAVCGEYARQDSRIKVIHQQNAGSSAARNAGLNICTGDYISFVDSDDTLKPDMYEKLISLATPGTDIICSGSSMEKEPLKYFYTGYGCALWNKLFRAELIKNLRFDTELYTSQDMVFVLEALLQAGRIVHMEEELYIYNIREGSASHSFGQRRMTSLLAFTKILELTVPFTHQKKLIMYKHAECLINLLREAIVYEAFGYIPTLQKEARKNLKHYLAYEKSLRQKARAAAAVFFPRFSDRAWRFAGCFRKNPTGYKL